MNDYTVHYKGKLVGIFRAENEARAARQAWDRMDGKPNKFSSVIPGDFVIIRVGML